MHKLNTICPFCKKENDMISDIKGDTMPQPGDFNVCIGCMALTVFDRNMKLRWATGLEVNEFLKMFPNLPHVKFPAPSNN